MNNEIDKRVPGVVDETENAILSMYQDIANGQSGLTDAQYLARRKQLRDSGDHIADSILKSRHNSVGAVPGPNAIHTNPFTMNTSVAMALTVRKKVKELREAGKIEEADILHSSYKLRFNSLLPRFSPNLKTYFLSVRYAEKLALGQRNRLVYGGIKELAGDKSFRKHRSTYRYIIRTKSYRKYRDLLDGRHLPIVKPNDERNFAIRLKEEGFTIQDTIKILMHYETARRKLAGEAQRRHRSALRAKFIHRHKGKRPR
jgi:hypothetical protein